jgi:hypothetical protein
LGDNQQIVKLRAQAEHLLDLFIALRERFAMLQPLAFDQQLAKRAGAGPPARGYIILRNTLLQSCIQDLVKLALDPDPRTPSITNLMAAFQDAAVRQRLLADYAVSPKPMLVGPGDPLPSEVLEDIMAREKQRLARDFEKAWLDLTGSWATLKADARLAAFKTWRDKLIAHAELHHAEGKYHLTDLSSLGLKWRDLGDVVAAVQHLVESIGTVTRGASFAWKMLDDQLGEASQDFWRLFGRALHEG